mmetsp:Transcript_20462/g.63645  ORF Transcript_20462/g.63645 Transcript_20462/m.63645 type:complete len:226 (+) Transcript_20462:750-1427(+)
MSALSPLRATASGARRCRACGRNSGMDAYNGARRCAAAPPPVPCVAALRAPIGTGIVPRAPTPLELPAPPLRSRTKVRSSARARIASGSARASAPQTSMYLRKASNGSVWAPRWAALPAVGLGAALGAPLEGRPAAPAVRLRSFTARRTGCSARCAVPAEPSLEPRTVPCRSTSLTKSSKCAVASAAARSVSVAGGSKAGDALSSSPTVSTSTAWRGRESIDPLQ